MVDDNKTANFDISASSLDINGIVASLQDEVELYECVRSASILIVPTDLTPEYDGAAFPLQTREIFKHLKTGCAQKAVVEVAVSDEGYREFDLRFDAITFPTMFVYTHALVPLVINLLSAYISDKFKSRLGTGETVTVMSEIHFIDSSGTQVFYRYDGPASTYEKVAAEQLRAIGVWKEGSELHGDDK